MPISKAEGCVSPISGLNPGGNWEKPFGENWGKPQTMGETSKITENGQVYSQERQYINHAQLLGKEDGCVTVISTNKSGLVVRTFCPGSVVDLWNKQGDIIKHGRTGVWHIWVTVRNPNEKNKI